MTTAETASPDKPKPAKRPRGEGQWALGYREPLNANEQFKKVLANWRAFRANQHRWFSIADTRAENAVYRSAPA